MHLAAQCVTAGLVVLLAVVMPARTAAQPAPAPPPGAGQTPPAAQCPSGCGPSAEGCERTLGGTAVARCGRHPCPSTAPKVEPCPEVCCQPAARHEEGERMSSARNTATAGLFSDVDLGAVAVSGWIWSVSPPCPPCPEGARCEPCAEPRDVLMERPRVGEEAPLGVLVQVELASPRPKAVDEAQRYRVEATHRAGSPPRLELARLSPEGAAAPAEKLVVAPGRTVSCAHGVAASLQLRHKHAAGKGTTAITELTLSRGAERRLLRSTEDRPFFEGEALGHVFVVGPAEDGASSVELFPAPVTPLTRTQALEVAAHLALNEGTPSARTSWAARDGVARVVVGPPDGATVVVRLGLYSRRLLELRRSAPAPVP